MRGVGRELWLALEIQNTVWAELLGRRQVFQHSTYYVPSICQLPCLHVNSAKMDLRLRPSGSARCKYLPIGVWIHTEDMHRRGLSAFYGKVDTDEERFKVLDRAYELGETHWDSTYLAPICLLPVLTSP